MPAKKTTDAPIKAKLSEGSSSTDKAESTSAQQAAAASSKIAAAAQEVANQSSAKAADLADKGLDKKVEGAETNSSVDESVALDPPEGAPVTTEPEDSTDEMTSLDDILDDAELADEEVEDDAVGIEAFVFETLKKAGAVYDHKNKNINAHIYNDLKIPLSNVGDLYYALRDNLKTAPIDFTLSEVENFQRVRDIVNDITRKLDAVGVAYKR